MIWTKKWIWWDYCYDRSCLKPINSWRLSPTGLKVSWVVSCYGSASELYNMRMQLWWSSREVWPKLLSDAASADIQKLYCANKISNLNGMPIHDEISIPNPYTKAIRLWLPGSRQPEDVHMIVNFARLVQWWSPISFSAYLWGPCWDRINWWLTPLLRGWCTCP